jgi:hypothetical protein
MIAPGATEDVTFGPLTNAVHEADDRPWHSAENGGRLCMILMGQDQEVARVLPENT